MTGRRLIASSPPFNASTKPEGGESFATIEREPETPGRAHGLGTLYIVGIPIGNPDDISLRALRILREVAVVVAEDVRFGKMALKSFGIIRDVMGGSARNRVSPGSGVTERLLHGDDIAFIAGAGTPLIADPGSQLVRSAIAWGVKVISVPGAVAAVSALVVSGLGNGSFSFDGFLPHTAGARFALLSRLVQENRTIVLYERHVRLKGTLKDLANALGPSRPIAISINLTRPSETTIRTTLGQAIDTIPGLPRGEYTLVIGPKGS